MKVDSGPRGQLSLAVLLQKCSIFRSPSIWTLRPRWRRRRESDSQMFCHRNQVHPYSGIDRDMAGTSCPHHNHHSYHNHNHDHHNDHNNHNHHHTCDFLDKMANGEDTDGFRSWIRKLLRVVGAAGRAPSLAGLCSGLCLLAPLLAGSALFVEHDMAPSLVMKFDGEDCFEGILPEVLDGRVGDVAVPPAVQQSAVPLCSSWDYAGLSVAPPVVALLCAQGWMPPLLRWLLVVVVCAFAFFLSPRGSWLVWVDERNFDVSLKGLFGAQAQKKGLPAAMLAATLAAMRWGSPAC